MSDERPGTPGQPEGEAVPETPEAPKPGKALPVILLGSGLAGMAAVLVGLGMTLVETLGLPSGAGGEGTPTAEPAPAAVQVGAPGQVGPGGAGVPLVAARPDAPPPVPHQAPAAPLAKAVPTRLVIPKIKVNAPLRSLGVDKNQEIQVPPLKYKNLAGWYKHGPTPGQAGPAVILGHVSNRNGPAVFGRLRDVGRGDKIEVVRSDKTVAVFVVDGVEQVNKRTFPSLRVYGNQRNATLRLVTCGGTYNRRVHSYRDNIIVYATLTATRPAA
ncbi:class F sortase [Bailinhaonella thermotolerans]|uniref:Sortase n=1 Tax=Bailinhaonella thermotolerans TaxID=1070861 RepID=A0A3A4AZZ3_9ACTN|nr:class F sortase [Bailinhaonella thermotolerans]RJL30780.1 sortase [Bailinhaonella thermotolerans]